MQPLTHQRILEAGAEQGEWDGALPPNESATADAALSQIAYVGELTGHQKQLPGGQHHRDAVASAETATGAVAAAFAVQRTVAGKTSLPILPTPNQLQGSLSLTTPPQALMELTIPLSLVTHSSASKA